ncbi:glutamine synthetase-like [Eucyclogobius newberryi]|uniref:glutamine synthetase-like n=1 Tax=Eucyclogobius newberryi TaxID=166745 RepID=UPI003B59C4D6
MATLIRATESAQMPCLSLRSTPRCQVTYVWINSSGTAPKAKTRILDSEPQCVQDVPEWFAAYSNNTVVQEVTLFPVQMFRDPFLLDPNKLVLCNVLELDGEPAPGNKRPECKEAMEAVKDQKPWFGFEQEYVLLTLDGKLFGMNGLNKLLDGVSNEVGLNKVFGREVSTRHCNACLYAGINIAGTAGEDMPAQWEFQVGPCGGLELGDHTWMARYILHRICEDFGVIASFHPKPIPDKLWGSGGHMNFSTESMRTKGGIKHIFAAIDLLAQQHGKHMEVYGNEENQKRLDGKGMEYSDFATFSWAIASRKCSVRIPGHVNQAGKGYLEDRRPSADCDPYLVCKALVQTCLLPPSDIEEEVIKML